MRRWLLLPILAVTLASLAAGKNAPRSAPVRRAGQFESNYGLIQVVVENSLRLAAEEDALKRADYCDGLVERFAAEINKASVNKDEARVTELGQHLHDLLSQGVAANLRSVRRQLPPGSALEKDLHNVRAHAEQSLKPVEEQLQQTAGSDTQNAGQHVLKLIHDARTELDKAVELKDDPHPSRVK